MKHLDLITIPLQLDFTVGFTMSVLIANPFSIMISVPNKPETTLMGLNSYLRILISGKEYSNINAKFYMMEMGKTFTVS